MPGWQGTDWSGVIPPAFSTQIIQEVTQASAALRLATRVPMGTTVSTIPVPKTFPKAGWVSVGGRKPFTDLSLELASMTAEEVAAVVAIPDVYRDDSSINLWAYARPLLAEAIALALDDAVLFGVDAPATFPAGGVAANAVATANGADVLETVNDAMSAVELGGLTVTGSAADIAVRGVLRGARDTNGVLLLGETQWQGQAISSLYGLPIAYAQFTQAIPDFITGAWRYLILGVRQDIRYDMNPAGVIADEDGKVIISGWQDNTTPMKVWARFACAVVKPVTPRSGPGGAYPFAKATLVGNGTGRNPAPNGGEGGEGASAQRATAATTAPAARSGARRA